nr:MAG TPA: hypothetical protein [Caudoviricetes sp.]
MVFLPFFYHLLILGLKIEFREFFLHCSSGAVVSALD